MALGQIFLIIYPGFFLQIKPIQFGEGKTILPLNILPKGAGEKSRKVGKQPRLNWIQLFYWNSRNFRMNMKVGNEL